MIAPIPPRHDLPAPKLALLTITTAALALLAGAFLPWPHAITAITLSTTVAVIVGVATRLIPCNLG